MAKRTAKKWVVHEHSLAEQHKGHSRHMCELVRARRMNEAASAAKGAKYLCHICGRAAAKAGNLCEPVEI
jgi:hypothetical protein